MSSGFWDKKDDHGIFESDHSHKKGLWSSSPEKSLSDHGPGNESVSDHGGPEPSVDGTGGGNDKGWEKLEEKYYKDFDSSADLDEPEFSRSYPYGQKDKYEPKLPRENQPENTFKDIKDTEEQEVPADGPEASSSGPANSYREEEQQITNVRRGGHKRLKNKLFSINRYAKRNRKGRNIPDHSDVLNRNKKDGNGNAQTNHGGITIPPEEENDYMEFESPGPEEYEKFSQDVEDERLRLKKERPSKEILEAQKATAEWFKFMYADNSEDQTEEDDIDEENEEVANDDEEDPYKNLF